MKDKFLFIGIAVAIFALSCAAVPKPAVDREIWYNAINFVSGDPTLKIYQPYVAHPSVKINATSPGDLKWISMTIPTKPGKKIKGIRVCYQLTNSRSFISQIRLAEMITPDHAVVKHDDGTDLLSTTPTCYDSIVAEYEPKASVLLELRLNFGDTADVITIGGIRVLWGD